MCGGGVEPGATAAGRAAEAAASAAPKDAQSAKPGWHGTVTDADHPLAVTFTHPQAIATGRFAGQPLIAVQLLEAVTDLLLAVVFRVPLD